MNWADEPATWKQLKFLRGVGYKPERPLTKTEAAALIRDFGGPAEPAPISQASDSTKQQARHLRAAVEDARRKVAEAEKGGIEKFQHELAAAITQRQKFWVDTCSDAGTMLIGSMQAQDLYQKHGCRFAAPMHQDVQYILDALDSAAPNWDTDHPELFYQTLEINFPQLLRRR